MSRIKDLGGGGRLQQKGNSTRSIGNRRILRQVQGTGGGEGNPTAGVELCALHVKKLHLSLVTESDGSQATEETPDLSNHGDESHRAKQGSDDVSNSMLIVTTPLSLPGCKI